MTQTLEDILQSVSDMLFPDALGEKKVAIDSCDCDGDMPLHAVLWRNDARAARLLIEAGANIDAVGDMGETPLHIAVTQENVDITRFLLERGAARNVKSEFGQTPYERAMTKGKEIVQLFDEIKSKK